MPSGKKLHANQKLAEIIKLHANTKIAVKIARQLEQKEYGKT